MMTNSTIGACALAVALVSTPSVASAEPACPIADVQALERVAFNLTYQTERRDLMLETQFHAIRHALFNLRGDDAAAGECSREELDRYDEWKHIALEGPLQLAHRRMGKICAAYGTAQLATARRELDRLLASNELSSASAKVDELEIALATDPLLFDCEPLAERTELMWTEYIPRIRSEVAVPAIATDLVGAYAEVAIVWRDVTELLGASDGLLVPVPDSVATADGRAALMTRAELCLAKTEALGDLGVARAVLDEGGEIAVADAYGLCAEIVGAAAEVFVRLDVHAEAYEVAEREQWEYFNIKGWGMQAVYDERGAPDAVLEERAAFVWTYEAECAEFRFTARGRLIRETPLTCAER
jgi:hypothetical protein